ncbi:MAG: glutamine amidotransferase [Planctomycetota bacterium]|jgi:GMP synthase (glutamine-hydrolysing)|nr:glutamine amidotransferase [Planctomycetota bacterium]
MDEKPILLLQTGDTPPFIRERRGNFDAMFLALPGLRDAKVRTVHASRGERPEAPERYRSVVVTGSHSMVTDAEDWSEAAAGWLAKAVEAGTPVFGVCYGHQLLAHALGGRVDYHPEGEASGTFEVELTRAGLAEPLLQGLPNRFPVNLAHSQTVVSLPGGAEVLAENRRDRRQLVRYGPGVFSCQFHPEFDQRIMRTYMRFSQLEDPGAAANLESRLALARDTPEAAGLIKRFVDRFP